MKLHHRVTGTLTAAVFAITSLAPAATPPQFKTPPTVKAPPSVPKVVTPPKVPVVRVPSAPKVPVVPKVQAPPKVPVVKVPSAPKVPAVRTPSAPKVPVVKVPATRTPVIVKTPSAPKVPAVKAPTVKTPVVVKAPTGPKTPSTPKVVKAPTLIKGTPGTKTPGIVSKTPVGPKTGVPATTTTNKGKAAPVTGITQTTQIQIKDAAKISAAAPLSSGTEATPPATQMTIQGGSGTQAKDKGKDTASSTRQAATAPEMDETSAGLLEDLGFDKAQAAKLVAQTQDPATRKAAQETIRVRADARAAQEALENFVGEKQAAVVGQKLIDPATRADTQKNLKLVLDAAANLQVTGVDDEKAHRVIDSLIRNGTTDKKIIDEITGRLIVKELTGKDVPQGDPDDADAPTALDVARNLINAKADLALVGVEDGDAQMAKAVEEIIKGRVTDPGKAREITETAAAEALEKAGVIPPGKPGETLQQRLDRAAKLQAEEVAAAKPKPTPEDTRKPVKKPAKPISLADSLKGRLAKVVGAGDSGGPKNDTGSSPSVLEIVFGSKKPRTGGPKGVKDGQQVAGITRGSDIKAEGAGSGKGKGAVGTIGDANGKILAKQGQVSQLVNTGGPNLARDPDSSPVKDSTRSPNQPQNGTPVDNSTPPAVPATPGAAGDPAATGNAQVAGEQDLPNTNPQQAGSTDPAASNMDTSAGTFTVTDAPGAGTDGNTAISFTVSGSPGGGADGNYVTTYFNDGTYITERVTADGGHELVGGGEGRPPANVQEGDSTNVVQGDEAVFAGDDTASGNGGNGGGGGDNNGGGGGGNDDDDDDKNDDNTADTDTPPATTEDKPAETAEENDDTAEASQEGTPNPNAAERGSRSGRLAEATQGRLGGDEQRRQSKALDQRKNGNGASTPAGDEGAHSGVLLTAQEKSAFAKHLGLQRSRGVTTPTGDETEGSIDIASALRALAVRRGALINPAGGIGDNGGSGQGFGKGGFTPGPAPAGPAPKGKVAEDDEFGPAPQSGTGGATGAVLGAPVGPVPAGVNASGAVNSNALKGAVRIDGSQVQQNVGR